MMLKDQFSESLLPLVMNYWMQRRSYSNLTYGRNEKISREKINQVNTFYFTDQIKRMKALKGCS